MDDWGTKTTVATERDAIAHIAAIQARMPEVPSAYVPSGKIPPTAFAWLAFGTALGAPAGALGGLVIGGLTILLVVVIGLLIGLMAAACGRVLCVVAAAEVLIAVVGAALTFGAAGAIPAWVTAWAGTFGKNRSAWAAILYTLPAALAAYLAVVGVPQAIAAAIGPPDPADDFAISTLAHLLADPSGLTTALYGLGLVVTLGAAAFFAHDAVGQQKFCERCEKYMDESALHGLAIDRAESAIAAIRRGAAAEIGAQLAAESGRDVAPRVFACPGCARGYFEATAYAHAGWLDDKNGAQERTADWLCASIETAPDATRALTAVRKQDEVQP